MPVHRQIDTDRMLLRPFGPGDLDDLARIDQDPEVMRYLRDGTPETRLQTEDFMLRIQADWDQHGFGLWAAELKEVGRLIGFIGLSHPTFLPEAASDVEVGWRLARAHWNRGLATEGARAALAEAFAGLGLDRVSSICQAANIASERVMQKLGMRLSKETTHPAYGHRLKVYELERAGWLTLPV